jgi:surface-anchored protein
MTTSRRLCAVACACALSALVACTASPGPPLPDELTVATVLESSGTETDAVADQAGEVDGVPSTTTSMPVTDVSGPTTTSTTSTTSTTTAVAPATVPAAIVEPAPPSMTGVLEPSPSARVAGTIASPQPLASASTPLRGAQTPLVLARGHVDLVEVARDGPRLVVSVKDDTAGGAPVYRSPTQVQLRVPDGSRVEVPSGPFAFLGAAGSQVFLLPQVQDPDLVWPGWSTERLGAGQLVGDALRLRLVAVEGPGSLAVFTTDQFGAPLVLFDSDDGAPDEISVPIRTHAHANWAFTAAGVHRVTVDVLGDLAGVGPTTTRVTYVFLVGDAAAPVPVEQVPPPVMVAPDGTPSPTPGTDPTGAPTGAASATPTTGPDPGARTASAAAATGAGRLASTGVQGDRPLLVGLLLVVLGVAAVAADLAVRRRARAT